MVIYFTEEDLVSFGEYMVSPQRRKHFESHPNPPDLSLEERLSEVYDADLSNWAHSRTIQNQMEQEMNQPNSIN